MIHKFNRQKLTVVGAIPPTFSVEEIEREPMLFSASWKFAIENGGPITCMIMNMIKRKVELDIENMWRLGYEPVIDTKSVMLMPGQVPCIGGWHCDGVIRDEETGQPNLESLSDDIRHFTCIVGSHSEVETTEFMTNYFDVYETEVDNRHVWKSVNDSIERFGSDNLVTESYSPGQIVTFGRDTLHRGPIAKSSQWRYFFRLSFYHNPPMNRIRHQVQVYANIGDGW